LLLQVENTAEGHRGAVGVVTAPQGQAHRDRGEWRL
jgi:hypothetical protein